MSVTPEHVLKQIENGMKAFEAFKEEIDGIKKRDALDEAKFDKITADIATAIEASQKREAEITGANKRIEQLEAALARPELIKSTEDAEVKAATAAFKEFAKEGAYSHPHDFSDFLKQKNLEIKALSTNTGGDGGFLVMPAFGGIIETRIFESSPIRQFANVESISTDVWEYVKDNDEASAGWVAETGSRSDTNTPTVDKGSIPVHEMYAQPKATQKMLDDSIVDVEQWLAKKVSDKLSRLEATAFISGDGVGKPTGILTNTTNSTDFSATAVQYVTSGSSGAITYDGMVNVQNALKEFYQSNARWLMKRGTFGSLMKIKSGITDDNTPIFNMMYDKNTGLAGFQVLGRPLSFAEDMPAVAADAKSVLYGDLASGYTIVDRVGIRILRDPFTAKPYVKFYTTKRVGGAVVNTEALKILALSS